MGKYDTITPWRRIAYDISMTLIALIAVLLRLHVRYFHQLRKSRPNAKRKHSVAYLAGDIFMFTGMLLLISFAASDIWLQDMILDAPLASSGRDLSGWLKLRVTAAKILTYQYFSGVLGLYAIKTSFLAYYFDAREGFSRRLRITLYACTGFIVTNFVVIMGYFVGKCRPFTLYWELSTQNCLLSSPLRDNIVITTTHIATDITIMIMGFLVIRTLRYHAQMLPAITFIFLLGVLTIIVNCLRCGVSIPLIGLIPSFNFLLGNKAAEKLAEWASLITLAELSVALVAVALPSLRVWWRMWAGEGRRKGRRSAEVMGGEDEDEAVGVGMDTELGMKRIEAYTPVPNRISNPKHEKKKWDPGDLSATTTTTTICTFSHPPDQRCYHHHKNNNKSNR